MAKKRFENKNLRKQIIWINTTIALVFCTILFAAFSVYQITERRRQQEYAHTTILQTKSQILEQILELGQSTTSNIKFNTQIIELFAQLNNTESDLNQFNVRPSYVSEVNSQILYYIVRQDFISRICLYNDKGDFTYVGKPIESYKASDYITEDKLTLLETDFENSNYSYNVYSKDLLSDENSSGYITIVQQIKDYTGQNDTEIGYVEVQIDFENLTEQMGEISSDEVIELFVNNKKFLRLGNTDKKTPVESIDSLPFDGVFWVKFTSYDNSLNISTATNILLVGVGFLALALVLIKIQHLLVKHITAPLIELCKNIAFTKSEKSEIFEEADFDEINELHNAFSDMQGKLQQSVTELVAERTGKIQAQMLALQAQINPHFIHNTLAINASLIEEGQYNQALLLSNKLSSMIRYTSDFTNNTVSLYNEFLHIEDYLQLIKIKYEDDFDYKVNYPIEACDINVPKFIMQPIIENSIVHSLSNVEHKRLITVDCTVGAIGWRVQVSDNGTGITPEDIKKVKERFLSISTTPVEELIVMLKNGGYSLMNTLIRMHLLYKDNVRFNIMSNEMGGTTVILGGLNDKDISA